MDVKSMLAPVTRVAFKVYGKAVKHSPEILLGSGLASMVAGAIVACERTTRAEDILYETRERIEKIHRVDDDPEVSYSESDKRKDLATVYASAGVKMAKLYWPAVALETLGVVCILGSYGIMRNRNVALTAAYTALEHGYSEYRRRVRDELGEDQDLYFKTGLKSKKIEVTETDEHGKEAKKLVEEKVFDRLPDQPSTYARWFDERSRMYANSAIHNRNFLIAQQQLANLWLHQHGYVFLNEVYRMLDIPEVPEGQVIGWLRDDTAGGQGYIDFGIHDGLRQQNRDFVNGYEKAVLLDFNIDPQPIVDYI